MSTRIYTMGDAQSLTRVQRGPFARWLALGVIPADLGGGGTSGAHRKLSFRNIFEIAIAVELQNFRVHDEIIRELTKRLRMIDPSTVGTVDIPMNRPETKAALAKLGVKGLAALNRASVARQRKAGVSEEMIMVTNPDAHFDWLSEELASADDNEAKRWGRFKNASTREGHGFISLGLMRDRNGSPIQGASRSPLPMVRFIGPHVDTDQIALIGPSMIVIDAAPVLERLEQETGDRL